MKKNILVYCFILLLILCYLAEFLPDNVYYIINSVLICSTLFIVLFKRFNLAPCFAAKNGERSAGAAASENEAYYKFGEVLLFSFLPVIEQIHIFAVNFTSISIILCILIIAAGISINIILYYLLNKLLKKPHQALIISMTAVFCIYNERLFHSYYALIYIILFLIILCTVYNFKNIIKFLQPFVITIIILNIGYAGFNFINENLHFAPPPEFNTAAHSIPHKLPDIYILLCDMYSGMETLNSLGFDNSLFIKTLEDKGFIVHSNILSNYNKTQASLPSFLNFDYVENIAVSAPSEAISGSKLFQLAKNAGYKLFYLNSWACEFKITNKYIDTIYESQLNTINETMKLMLHNSRFRNYFGKFTELDNAIDFVYNVIQNKTDKKFLFAHILMPHWPYVYDKNGVMQKNTNDIELKNTDFKILNKKSYLNFLEYTNKTILEIVSEIQSSDKNAVIIISGDHGVRTKYCTTKKSESCLDTEFEENKKAGFNTFLAYYNPDIDAETYTKSDNLINFYRNFANEVFGTNYEKAVNKQFYIYYSTVNRNIHRLPGREAGVK